MATKLVFKKNTPSHITYNTKSKFNWKKRLLCATGFIGFGLVASILQFSYIHNKVDINNPDNSLTMTFLTSGIEPIPTIHPLIREVDKLREENGQLKSLVSRGEIDRKTADAKKQLIISNINKFLEGGLLANKGEIYYQAGMNQNVSAVLLAAITIHETSSDDKNGNWKPGNSKVLRDCNNVAGINWTGDVSIEHKGRYRVFKNIDESIFNLAYIIKNYYINQGLTDIASIGAKFAPISDYENGKYGMNNNIWSESVTRIYNNISKEIGIN